MKTKKWHGYLIIAILISVLTSSCKKGGDPAPPPVPDPPAEPPAFDINSIGDTYSSLAPVANYLQWGPYNVHDPSIVKSGEYFYAFSTDVAYGATIRPGIQIRRSKDLVQWNYVGWVFNGLPPMGSGFITQGGGTPFQSLWAPYVIKAGNEFRLYYSLSCSLPRLSVIGLATATNPEGPWKEQGLVVVSKNDNTVQTNAIDPSVVITPGGEHWLYYGSAWDGIYVVKLNPATGMAQNGGDKGVRIAQRGFTNGIVNGNIEGPEIIFNAAQNKYYLFIAYDWLETKYNVRVGRSDSPQGPFLDYKGNDLNLEKDDGPMILAPYKFQLHGGWQGVAHCSVFEDNGQYFMAHQGRPGVDKYYMVMHVRKIFWTQDGWPVVSPERYANTAQASVASAELTGEWERIVMNYTVTPGYANEQTSPDFQSSVNMVLNADGKIDGNAAHAWSYTSPWLTLSWSNGASVEKVYISRERDWENKKTSVLVFTGLNQEGTAVWGKKK